MLPRIINNINELNDLIGSEVAVTDYYDVTQEHICFFAEATQDKQWIHLDVERAKEESPYKTTIAHGFLILSLLAHFLPQAITMDFAKTKINYGLNSVRFPAPVPAGSKIRARFSLSSLKQLPKTLQVVWKVVVECEGASKPVCVAEWIVLYNF